MAALSNGLLFAPNDTRIPAPSASASHWWAVNW